MTHEIKFRWITDKMLKSDIRHSDFIPRVGEIVDLGYVPESGYVEKKVTEVRYVFNSNYVSIFLEEFTDG